MARWIRQRPEGSSDATEKEVADLLATLPDTWTIRWGYFYRDSFGVEREGDFLLLSPEGEVLVMEVKGGSLRTFMTTGMWEGDDDNPYVQLLAEWSAVLERLRRHSGLRRIPYVHRCLCYPREPAIGNERQHHLEIARNELLDGEQIKNFAGWWNRKPNRNHNEHERSSARELFLEVFAAGATPKAQQHFLDETDRILERHTQHEFRLLDHLQDNRQLLVQGGTGSGKTSLAIEQARRWAAQGERVLMLCYNLPLEDRLAQLVARLPTAGGGSVSVRSFESLGKELSPATKQPFLRGATAEERKASDLQYFEETLPAAMIVAVGQTDFEPPYDSLVVDEAQDLNTTGSAHPAPAWWHIYVRLLKGGWEAPISVYYDPAQRLPWRTGSFDISHLENFLLTPVRVRLTRPLRYTRPILAYLGTLQSAETEQLVRGIKKWGSAPIGPEVELHESASDVHDFNLITAIIARWRKEGSAEPDDVLVLHPGRSKAPAWTTASTKLLDPNFPASGGRAAMLSMHRAKGLEARAVIVVARGPFDALSSSPGEQHAFFLACSRARQLLAVIYRRE